MALVEKAGVALVPALVPALLDELQYSHHLSEARVVPWRHVSRVFGVQVGFGFDLIVAHEESPVRNL